MKKIIFLIVLLTTVLILGACANKQTSVLLPNEDVADETVVSEKIIEEATEEVSNNEDIEKSGTEAQELSDTQAIGDTNAETTTNNNGNNVSNTSPNTNVSTTQQPKTRIIQHAMGSLEVPAKPERIVVLSAQHADHLISLGITPIGSISGAGGREVDWLHNRMPGTTYIGHFHSPSVEMILSLRPDLILGVEKHNSKAYGSLSKIAPTVLLQDMEADWREIYKYIAEVVGREDVAKARLKEFDNRLSKGKQDIATKLNNGETVLFMRVHHKESRLFGTNSHIGKIAYGGLGLRPPSITPTNVAELPIALEKLPEFEVDHIFLLDTAKKENQDVIKEMQQNPIWKNTKAVQNGNVHLLGDLNDSRAGKSLVLYNLIVDGILDGLLK
ncbi:ABC transporter substrate-binding protein [Desulfuribacillus alkaliarsenatis]|uniref:Fe/B12 periplasmic-binding domain-containing protein n=1 Tax=Desulfuribacillus alkaliarsenatis TaxID=766136 RepID=A0A1E5G5S5_9FIRM|nr:ABC transporter substrate-binding protein [Desulfuribacillus alkaliarsenatis]OEF98124.1 hypothetical protein BHF68_00070 [Desulfuribacillus alkaliarsenatis]